MPEDLGEPDEHGIFTHTSATGVLFFRQTRSSFSQPGGGGGGITWEWSTDRRFWLPTSSADSLCFGPDACPSAADRVLIRRLEVEAQLLGRQEHAPLAAEALPPLDLSQATRNLSQVDQVPSAFLCPLSLRIMTQPCVTPSGATYDRPALLDWIRQFHTDPASGHPLKSGQVSPNLALRDLIHIWAHSGEPKRVGHGSRVLL